MSITLNCAWVMYNLGGAIFISHCVCLQRALGATTLGVRSPLASCPGFRKATDPQTLGIRSLVVEALPLHWLSHPGQKPYPSTPWYYKSVELAPAQAFLRGRFDTLSIIFYPEWRFELQLLSIYIPILYYQDSNLLILLSPTCLCQHLDAIMINDQTI